MCACVWVQVLYEKETHRVYLNVKGSIHSHKIFFNWRINEPKSNGASIFILRIQEPFLRLFQHWRGSCSPLTTLHHAWTRHPQTHAAQVWKQTLSSKKEPGLTFIMLKHNTMPKQCHSDRWARDTPAQWQSNETIQISEEKTDLQALVLSCTELHSPIHPLFILSTANTGCCSHVSPRSAVLFTLLGWCTRSSNFTLFSRSHSRTCVYSSDSLLRTYRMSCTTGL